MDKLDIGQYHPYQTGRQSRFVSTEKRCTHISINGSKHLIRHFKIDGVVFTKGQATPRCDYLLLNDDLKTSYYIELKGSDLHQAIRQVENTIQMFCDSLPGYRIRRRIVYSGHTHRTMDKEILRWKLQHKETARIEQGKIEENIF